MKFPKLTLSDEDFKTAFVAGEFAIDCVEIKITQNGVPSPLIYKSSGTLLVTPERGLEGALVIPRSGAAEINPITWLQMEFQTKSGQLVPDSRYFKLEATDAWGRVWRHPAAHVRLEDASAAATLKISCDYVVCEMKSEANGASSPSWTHMVTLDELEFPLNVVVGSSHGVGPKSTHFTGQSSQGNVDGMTLEFDPGHRRAGTRFAELYVRSEPGATLPIGFQDRLMEAISFMTATIPTWVMTETEHAGVRTIELFKARTSNSGGLVGAPWTRQMAEKEKPFYKMLECYYKYSRDMSTNGEPAPISRIVGKLFTLKNVWIDSVALSVSVTVEALLSEGIFKNLGMPSQPYQKDVDRALEAIKRAKVREGVLIRAIGSVKQIKSARAQDRLKVLAAAGAVTTAEIANWKSLRNKTAHGNLHIDPKKMQRLVDDVYGSVALVYKLIFVLIGYDGPYNDYSIHGWIPTNVSATEIASKLIAGPTPPARRLPPIREKVRPSQRLRRRPRLSRSGRPR